MASANNKTTSTAKTTAKAAAKQPEITEQRSEEKPIVAKEIDPNQIVIVKNGFQGKLTYTSPRTKEIFKWDSFGDEQEIELRELRNAKSSAKKFFINNWFMFDKDDAWVIDYLGLRQYYKYAISLEGFDDIFTKSPEEIESVVSKLSDGQKKSIAYKSRQLIADGEIDSRKVIMALENALGVELIEK